MAETTMTGVKVYTTNYCGYCRRAKALLASRGIPFEEIDVTSDDQARDDLMDRAEGRRTVPVIFFGDKPIGGYEELAHLDRKGELTPELAARLAALRG